MPPMTGPPRRRGRLIAHPSDLAVLVGFNGVAQLAPVVVALALTPLLLHRLGLDRFGIWSFALVIVSTLTALDGGISASLARFFAIYNVHDDREDTARLLLGSVLFFLVLGLGLTLAALPLAPVIGDLLHIPSRLEGEAVFVLRWLPALATLALISDATAALLQGTGQFRALAGSMVASSAAFALAIVVLVQPGAHLRTLVIATALRYAVLVVGNLVFAAGRMSFRRPLLPSRDTARGLVRYASRMQLSVLAGFAGSESDALVIAALLPVRYVGLYSIGLQAASAARSLPLYGFAPLLTRLTSTFRSQGREGAVAEFEELERWWLPAVLGYGVVAIAAIGFSVPLWLGNRYVLSGVAAAILLTGFMVHVGFTGMRTCYVRAIGRPGLETRYSLIWTLGNAVLTIPLALLAGLVGVVSATAVAATLASLYFIALCRRTERLRVMVPGRRWWSLATVAAGITVAGELAVVHTNLHGFFALALSGMPALLALGVVAAGLRSQRKGLVTSVLPSS